VDLKSRDITLALDFGMHESSFDIRFCIDLFAPGRRRNPTAINPLEELGEDRGSCDPRCHAMKFDQATGTAAPQSQAGTDPKGSVGHCGVRSTEIRGVIDRLDPIQHQLEMSDQLGRIQLCGEREWIEVSFALTSGCAKLQKLQHINEARASRRLDCADTKIHR